MNPQHPEDAGTRQTMSGNAAVARGVWEAGACVAAASPGPSSTKILANLARLPDMHVDDAVNERVALEVAIGASLAGARAFCTMQHVGVNIASDVLMSLTLTGVVGGLVIAIADDVGFVASQTEQDSRFWGRLAHLPIFEPTDPLEAYGMVKSAFAFSETHDTPVLLRVTLRVCESEGTFTVGERMDRRASDHFARDPGRWVMVPANARRQVRRMHARDKRLATASLASTFNRIDAGSDPRLGFVTSGPTYAHVRQAFPEAPILKLGFSYPVPFGRVRELAAQVGTVVVVEETEPILETEIKAQGIAVRGKDLLPSSGELSPAILYHALSPLLGEEPTATPPTVEAVAHVPTQCAACPHLGAVHFALSHVPDAVISGDISCHTLGAGQPWNSLDTCLASGASMGMALGLDKGRGLPDERRKVVAVIDDTSFLRAGMQGLLDIVRNQGNVTVVLLDNRSDAGCEVFDPARVDLPRLVEALGIPAERIHTINPNNLPALFAILRHETATPGPSVIISARACALALQAAPKLIAMEVDETACIGCGTCLRVECPAIIVTRREQLPEGEKTFVRIETAACTDCGACLDACEIEAIRPRQS